jgi:hypothetical protein
LLLLLAPTRKGEWAGAFTGVVNDQTHPIGGHARRHIRPCWMCGESPARPVAIATPAGTYVCSDWNNGICVSAHRAPGVTPYNVGYVFGPNYTYTAITDLPQPVVTYYKLGPN